MKCHEVEDLLEQLLDQELDLKQRSAVEHHLLSCTACSTKLADISMTRDLLHDLMDAKLPLGLHQRIMTAVWTAQEQQSVAPKADRERQGISQSERVMLYGASRPFSRSSLSGWTRVAAVAAVAALLMVSGKNLVDRGAALPRSSGEYLSSEVPSMPSFGSIGAILGDTVVEKGYDSTESPAVPEEEPDPIVLDAISPHSEEAPTGEQTEADAGDTPQDSEGAATLSDEEEAINDPVEEVTSALLIFDTDVPDGESPFESEASSAAQNDSSEAPVILSDDMPGDANAAVESQNKAQVALRFAMPEMNSVSESESAAGGNLLPRSQTISEVEETGDPTAPQVGASYSMMLLPNGREASQNLAENGQPGRWLLTIPRSKVDSQKTLILAQSLDCLTWIDPSSENEDEELIFYGSMRNLQLLLQELQLPEPIWSRTVEQRDWLHSLSQDSDRWFYLNLRLEP